MHYYSGWNKGIQTSNIIIIIVSVSRTISTYSLCLIQVFGLRVLRTGYYDGYNDTVDGSIPTSFGTAAFRFGHSLVQPNLHRSDEAHREMPYRTSFQ